jgi:cholesterol oxidase
LPLAKQNGAEIYTQVEILSIRAAEGYYELSAVIRDDSVGTMHEERVTIASQIVIVAAGSPGSAEILLQSRACGLELSPAIGERWSFNGDTIGFVVDPRCRAPIGGVGTDSCDMAAIGPTVQTSLIYNRRPELQHRLLVQESAVPSLTTRIFSLLLQDPDLDRSMIMLGMGHDGARGKIIWKDDRWQIDWPDLRDSQYRKMVFNDFNTLAQAHGGWYKRLRLFGDTLVSVHPLGGCGMSDDPLQGVVNDRGQVFAPYGGVPGDSPDGPPVYPGLYVADGSVMPTSLGVNPLMTICAVAERIAEQIAHEPRWASLFHGRTFRG